jgi:Fe-S oxidoreductase
VRAKGIASEVADLVKAYRGSLSGEHGDGRLRGPYLEQVLGAEMVELLRDIKRHFDPAQLFNPGSVLTDVPMDKDWRFHPEYRSLEVDTAFRYDRFDGFQRAIEACNGAGECRKSAEAGGTMCPSYMVTKEERESTRGRANLFRRLLQGGPEALFGSEELKDALELCLSCKGCKRDCPASVDMATLKAEFEQGYQDRHGASIAARAFASVTELAKPAQWVPGAATIANAMQSTAPVKALMRATLGIATERTLPSFAPKGFQALWRRHRPTLPDVVDPVGRVVLFIDEFTDRYEPEIGLAAAELLHRGGVDVIVPQLGPSGRTHLSKGFVRDARRHIEHNLAVLEPYVTGPSPVDAIVGIEPSAVLTYIDESLELPSSAEARSLAAQIAAHVQLVEDFVVAQSRAGRWRAGWSEEPRTFLLHGHCHQKALVGLEGTRDALALPANTKVQVIPSGCCGMAGSFGYQAKHYETSMAIGELVLFPAVREAPNDTVVVAPGTSCRHQIQDGTQRASVHPVQALLEMLRPI